MLICKRHWDMLVDGIKDHGLAQLVQQPDWSLPEPSDVILARLTVGKFDPLLFSVELIMTNAAELLGEDYTGSPEAAQLCPVCEVLRLAEETWTAGIADAARQAAVERRVHKGNGNPKE